MAGPPGQRSRNKAQNATPIAEQALPYNLLRAETSDNIRDWNAYGITAAQYGSSRRARQAFTRVLQIDPDYLNARLNLGSLLFLDGDYAEALEAYRAKAIDALGASGGMFRQRSGRVC